MNKLPFKKRRPEPAPIFFQKFVAAMDDFASVLTRTAQVAHSGSKGTHREKAIQRFFSDHLPGMYGVAGGEVRDLFDNVSGQLDIMIYDKLRNYPFLAEDPVVLPAEALLASIEVKTKLDKSELSKSITAALKLKALRPHKRELAGARQKGERADNRLRYLHCIFAYSSDVSGGDVLAKEFERYKSLTSSMGVPLSTIDRIYIPGVGLILTDERQAQSETSPGLALMSFYMNLMNFLHRENTRRRHPAPYIDYAGRLSQGWRHL